MKLRNSSGRVAHKNHLFFLVDLVELCAEAEAEAGFDSRLLPPPPTGMLFRCNFRLSDRFRSIEDEAELLFRSIGVESSISTVAAAGALIAVTFVAAATGLEVVLLCTLYKSEADSMMFDLENICKNKSLLTSSYFLFLSREIFSESLLINATSN